MLCIHCRYDLEGSQLAKRCPECGKAFDPANPTTFLVPVKPLLKRRQWISVLVFLMPSIIFAAIAWRYGDWQLEITDPPVKRGVMIDVPQPIRIALSLAFGMFVTGVLALIALLIRSSWRRLRIRAAR